MMIASGKGFSICLDTLLSEIDIADLAGAHVSAVYSLTIQTMDMLTGVKTLPDKFQTLGYATSNTQHCWNEFVIARNRFTLNPTQDNFTAAYFAYISYYEAAALSEDAFVSLAEASKDAWLHDLYLGEPVQRAATRAAENSTELHNLVKQMRRYYAAWNGEDTNVYDNLNDDIAGINGYSDAGGGGSRGTW